MALISLIQHLWILGIDILGVNRPYKVAVLPKVLHLGTVRSARRARLTFL